MSTLSGQNLRKYLSDVMAIELSCYAQEQYLQKLQNLEYKARHPNLYEIKNEVQESPASPAVGGLAGIGVAIAIVVFYEIVIFVALGIYELTIGPLFQHSFYYWLVDWGGEKILSVGGGIAIFVICAIVGVSGGFAIHRDEKNTNQSIRAENEKNRSKNQQIITQSQKEAKLLALEIERASSVYQSTIDIRQSLYSINVIYKKYWGLVPVTMFNEYFDSGRCSTLPEAYDRYENEIRLDLILTKMDDIISRLDRIEQNQYMLAMSIHEMNRSIASLASAVDTQIHQLSEIAKNQQISNFYNQITFQNTSYMAWVAFNSKM